MALTVKEEGGGDFEMVPEGQYIARCIKIIDLGTQTTNSPQWGEKSSKKIMIMWELLDDEVKMKDGRPFSISQRYTASLHEKSQLRAHLEAWRGKKFTEEELSGFDLKTVLGQYCQIQVVHSVDGKYANIQAIMAVKFPKDKDGNQIKPEGVNPTVVFDIDEPDMTVFDGFGEGLKGTIRKAPEWQGKEHAPVPVKAEITKSNIDDHFPGQEAFNDDEIPF